MRGASRDALAAARERCEPLLRRLPSSGAAELGGQLHAVVGLLDSSVALRRALTDSARAPEDRAALAQRLLRGQVDDTALDVVTGMVRQRWSEPRDLADALEELSTEAVLASAEADGSLDRVEDELFRFSRLVAGDRGLQSALDDRTAAPAQRSALVERLLAGRTAPATLQLVRQAAASPRGRHVEPVLEELVEAAAARRRRLLAVVTAAVPLDEAQRERLTAALGRVYGSAVLVQVDVDPTVLGGLSVRVGEEVLDATVVSRLAQARRRAG